MPWGWFFGGGRLSALIRLNPWAAPFKSALAAAGEAALGSDFREARTEAALRRLALGAEAWNAWSSDMSALREQAPDDSTFLRAWEAVATFEIESRDVVDTVDGGACYFPGAVRFRDVVFRRDVWFSLAEFQGEVEIADARFCGSLALDRARLAAPISIERSVFEQRCEFTDFRTESALALRDSVFERDVWFRDARLKGTCDFGRTVFQSDIGFTRASFGGAVDFATARFEASLGFEGARFASSAKFDGARLDGRLWLGGVRMARAIDRTALAQMAQSGVGPSSAPGSAQLIAFPRKGARRSQRKKGA